MNRTVLVTSMLALAGLALGGNDTSENIGYGAYQDTTGRVTLVVGAQAAAISQHEKFIPLQIALAVQGAGPELEVAMARFTLIDASGNILDPASTAEMAKQASSIQFMNEFRRTSPLPLGNQFNGLREITSDFYPLQGGKFFVEEHLSRESWLRDVIYFPTPEAGLVGVMMLQFLTPGMDGAAVVRFEAPVKQNRHQEQEEKAANKAAAKESKKGN
jgi:hypothetical protein